uniref:Uncharacterized protein n=1 Tax=Anguilla anguilla TaxID=7936 RepID=A0A0E9U124_ANGAN
MCTSPPCFAVLQLGGRTSALQIRTFRCLAFPAQTVVLLRVCVIDQGIRPSTSNLFLSSGQICKALCLGLPVLAVILPI